MPDLLHLTVIPQRKSMEVCLSMISFSFLQDTQELLHCPLLQHQVSLDIILHEVQG